MHQKISYIPGNTDRGGVPYQTVPYRIGHDCTYKYDSQLFCLVVLVHIYKLYVELIAINVEDT